MPEENTITNPSGEAWYVEKYALEDNEIGWFQVGDLTEGEQKSLVYYLLTNPGGMAEENTLREIIEHKPALLAFYRAGLLADIDQLEELGITDIENWWLLAKDATDAEIDSLVAQFDDYKDEVILLLLGANTDYALQQLAQLAKDSDSIIQTAADMHVIITQEGTFERRFLTDSYSLFKAPDDAENAPLPDGLKLLEVSETALEGGKVATCNNPIPALLNIDFTKVAPFKGSVLEKTGSYHFFSSNCEACDAWLESNVFQTVYQKPWKFLGTYVHYSDGPVFKYDIDPEEADCDPESAEPLDEHVPANLFYGPEDVSRNKYKRIATLGGRPNWVQSPEVPDCPKCHKMMFYVGQNQASQWTGYIGDQVVFGFVCEACMQAIQVMQCT